MSRELIIMLLNAIERGPRGRALSNRALEQELRKVFSKFSPSLNDLQLTVSALPWHYRRSLRRNGVSLGLWRHFLEVHGWGFLSGLRPK